MFGEIPVFKEMDRAKCCGCEACANVCPMGIIQFTEDEEGFKYPEMTLEKCVGCNACVRVCPQLKAVCETTTVCECFGGYAKDNQIVLNSSSGGIYSLIVEWFKSHFSNGMVVGVVWEEDFSLAKYIITDDIKDLERIRGSKYVQAEKGRIYSQIKNELRREVPVLFVGCPCEVAALKSFLGKDADSIYLYTIDFVCKGPTSNKVLQEYLTEISPKERPTFINMRVVGRRPWIPQWMKIEFKKKRTVFMPFYMSSLGVAFQILQRKSCYNCEYIGKNRYSDITLGDFHGADVNREYYNADGTSAIVVNTQKGKEMLEGIKANCVLEPVEYEEIAAHNPRLNTIWGADSRRYGFSEKFKKYGLKRAWNSVMSLENRIKINIKKAIYEFQYRRGNKR